MQDWQDCFSAPEDCEIPVIAAINGFCLGAGIDVITACDIRLCEKSSLFKVAVRKLLQITRELYIFTPIN